MVDFILFLEGCRGKSDIFELTSGSFVVPSPSHCGLVQVEFVDEVMQIPVTKTGWTTAVGKSGGRP